MMARKWMVRRKFLHGETALRELGFMVPRDPDDLGEFVGRLLNVVSLQLTPEQIAYVLQVEPKDIEAVEVPDEAE
jgi:hypothetical protein